MMAQRFRSRVGQASARTEKMDNLGLSSIRTKAWAELEVSASEASLVGACVSGDVHLGHILLARGSNGTKIA